jgi:mono/diheme cytochrome c family protein
LLIHLATSKRLGALALSFLFGAAIAQEGEPKPPASPPSAAEGEKLFQAGKDLYEVTCLSCHQANGMGLEALAPPLVGSHWITNSVERLVRIALHGMRGPVKVNGQIYRFETEMLPLAVLSDEQLAAVLTYVRREWGHRASPVSVATVAKIREATASREQPWTEDELLKIP